MRVAVAYSDGNVADEFRTTKEFKLYDIEDGRIGLEQSVEVRQDWYMSVAEFLAEQEVDAIICGKIGRGPVSSFREGGIKVYGGVSGSAKDAINAYLGGTLSFDPMAGMM